MTVRSIPARRASAPAGASSLTPVLSTGVVSRFSPPGPRGLQRHLLLVSDGRVPCRDGRIRQRDGRIRGVPVALDGRIRAAFDGRIRAAFDGRIRSAIGALDGRIRRVLAAPPGRLCPATAR